MSPCESATAPQFKVQEQNRFSCSKCVCVYGDLYPGTAPFQLAVMSLSRDCRKIKTSMRCMWEWCKAHDIQLISSLYGSCDFERYCILLDFGNNLKPIWHVNPIMSHLAVHLLPGHKGLWPKFFHVCCGAMRSEPWYKRLPEIMWYMECTWNVMSCHITGSS